MPTEWEFRKSSQSAMQDCVESLVKDEFSLVRDSKAPDSGVVRVSADAWKLFLSQVK